MRSLPVACDAGTAFDGRHLYQLSADRILKIDPETGRVLSELPAPADGASGLTWAEGRARATGRGRARRWLSPPASGFTTALLLPVPPALG